MTEEQFKVLAELMLINDARLTVLTDSFNKWMEITLPLFPADSDAAKRAGALLSSIEQQEALSRDSEVARDQLRKFFGLD